MKRAVGVVAAAFVGAGAAGQIEFVGEQFDFEHSLSGPIFGFVEDDGDLWGREVIPDYPEMRMVARLGGDVAPVDPGIPDLYLWGPSARSHSGRWLVVDAARFAADPYDLEREHGVYDTETRTYLPLDLPGTGHDVRAVDDSGGRVAGGAWVGSDGIPDWAGERPVVWVLDDDGFRLLPSPAPPPGREDWTEMLARRISADGQRVLGSVMWDAVGHEPFVSEVVLWTDSEPEALPHALSGEFVSSWSSTMSPDGTVVIGFSGRYTFVPGEPGQWGSWVFDEKVAWRWKDGEFTQIVPMALDHPTGYPEPIYMLTESLELIPVEEYLEGLGVDLGGRPFVYLLNVSPGKERMLGVLGVGDGFEQQAIISIPCSAADLTADRELGLDDVQAFVDRFTSGHPLADLNDDGLLGLADVLRFVELYRAGCPD